MARHFARVQNEMVSRGLMRTDNGLSDAPFSQRQLVENFVQIALFDEYVAQNGTMVARPTESKLRRWEQPIRMNVIYGDTVTEEQRRKDSYNISTYTDRLSRLSGLPITQTKSGANANFNVLILNEDERRAFGPTLRELVPGIDNTAIRTITDIPRSTFCLVFAFSRGSEPRYSHAIAVIRAEHPDRMRLSCIHEELAQGLGLANDSPAARPSVFNDDEEFALLTYHDELLVRMLYDRRLTAGMNADEARPILRDIASDLMGGNS